MNHAMLAYTPFLDPLNIESWWYFTLIPLAFFVSVAYKAIRVHTFEHYWRNVLIMTAQIVLSIAGLAVLMFVLITQLMPRIAAR
jgi:hypothetical protein